jgi:hypothetical protein
MEGALRVAIDAGAFDVAMWIMIAGALRTVLTRLGSDGPGLLKALDRRAAVRRALKAGEQVDRDHACKVMEKLLDEDASHVRTRCDDAETTTAAGPSMEDADHLVG